MFSLYHLSRMVYHLSTTLEGVDVHWTFSGLFVIRFTICPFEDFSFSLSVTWLRHSVRTVHYNVPIRFTNGICSDKVFRRVRVPPCDLSGWWRPVRWYRCLLCLRRRVSVRSSPSIFNSLSRRLFLVILSWCCYSSRMYLFSINDHFVFSWNLTNILRYFP